MTKYFTIQLEAKYKEPLEQIALSAGYPWGTRGNVKEFFSAVAERKIPIGDQQVFLLPEEEEAILDAVEHFCIQGDWSGARSLARLLNHKTLSPPLDARLEGFLKPLKSGIYPKIEQFIDCKQPFSLSYLDAAGQLFQFNIYYAELIWREKRYYLEVWHNPEIASDTLPELAHNRCLRLDRLPPDPQVVPLPGEWRGKLDTAEVQFDLFGNLAYAFSQEEGDRLEWIAEKHLRVTRYITNDFWFLRAIARYGADVEVVSPPSLREKVRGQLQLALSRY